MATDTGKNLLEPGRHPARPTCSSCSSARPSSGPSTSTRICCAPRSRRRATTTAWAPTRRRRRSSPSSWATCSRTVLERDREAAKRSLKPGGVLDLGTPDAAAAAARREATATAPPVRLHRQQVRVPRGGLERVASPGPTPCSTRSWPSRSTSVAERARRPPRKRSGAKLQKAVTSVAQGAWAAQAGRVRRRQLRRGVAQGSREARSGEPAHDAGGAAVADREKHCSARSGSTRSSPSASSTRRDEVFTEQYAVNINIESETETAIARRCCCRRVRYRTNSATAAARTWSAEVEPPSKS